MILLFALRLAAEERKHLGIRLLIDCAVVSIKPYYAIIVLALILRNYSLRALVFHGLYGGVILPTVVVNVLIGLVGQDYSDVVFTLI